MLVLTCAFIFSLLSTLLVLRSVRVHGAHSRDRDFTKPQKFHVVAVPRIGGVGIVVGLLVSVGALEISGHAEGAQLLGLLLACAVPAFLAGFVQDITESLTPKGRLVATSVSALLAFVLLDAGIRATSIPGLDALVSFAVGSLFVTMFAVAGIANAINIVDGFNGLASMCVILMLAAVAYVAFKVGDPLIGIVALAGIGSVLGFFIWNFPFGLIFLGDGGAYFLGFYFSEVSILLLLRNPEVSPLFPLLVCIYPVFETVFSIYRRRVLRQRPPLLPDGIHLHSLIYRRIMRWASGDTTAKSLIRRNSMTSPVLWMLCMAAVVPAVLFWDSTPALGLLLLLYGATHAVLYWRIVRFRSPRLLRRLSWGCRRVRSPRMPRVK